MDWRLGTKQTNHVTMTLVVVVGVFVLLIDFSMFSFVPGTSSHAKKDACKKRRREIDCYPLRAFTVFHPLCLVSFFFSFLFFCYPVHKKLNESLLQFFSNCVFLYSIYVPSPNWKTFRLKRKNSKEVSFKVSTVWNLSLDRERDRDKTET